MVLKLIMKNFKKILFTFLLTICFAIILTVETEALEIKSWYKYYSDVANIDVGNITFANTRLYVKNNTYGIKSMIINHSDVPISLYTQTYYYDSNQSINATSSSQITQTIDPGITEHIERLSFYGNYNFDDIKYFSIKATSSESEDVKLFDKNTPVEPIYKAPEISHSYKIKDYDIDIKLSEDNVLDITEKITVDFLEGGHGIKKQIPITNKVYKENGKTYKINAQISDLEVNDEYKASTHNEQLTIVIGNENKILDGEKEYIIKYKYNIGRDKMKDRDEFYFNIIDSQWDTVIENLNFTVNMPKPFDRNKIKFIWWNSKKEIDFTDKGNQIKGKYNGVIDPNSTITLQVTLEDGYFKNAGYKMSTVQWISIIVSFLFLVSTIYLWLKNNQSKTKIREYYPPNHLNSLELAFLYKGKADSDDLLSILMYLAHKKYIKIEKMDKTEYDDFKIIKEREYDGNNIYENMLSRIFLIKMMKFLRQRKIYPKRLKKF